LEVEEEEVVVASAEFVAVSLAVALADCVSLFKETAMTMMG